MQLSNLPWDRNVAAMPVDIPTLVKMRDKPVPFMGVRAKDDDELVGHILGPDENSYGTYEALSDVECWLNVLRAEEPKPTTSFVTLTRPR
jgi:hypothetical protein